MPSLEEYARKRDVRGMFITAIITAMAFVVGLFWNDAIRSGIETIIPVQERLSAKFMAAFAVTVLVVLVAWTLVRTEEIGETAAKQLQKRMSVMERQLKKQAEFIHKQRLMLKKARKK